MNKRKLLARIANNPKSARFDEVVSILNAFGFHLSRVRGSHHIFVHPEIPEIVNLQDVHSEAKSLSGSPISKNRRASQFNIGGRPMKDYHINIFYSDEDKGYIADIPDLEACSAFGDTAEDALREVEVAKEAWIESARAEGKPVPPPAYRPLIYQFSQ